jgi:biopolymer transport protein ExbD
MASGPAQPIIQRHVRRRRASFVLTSLIDVIFLLVIFFMVSSQITPFSIIALDPIVQNAAAPSPATPPPATAAVSLRVMAGSVRIAGQTVAMDGLEAALSALKQSGVTALIVVPTDSATVQDLVSVLESIKAAGIESATVLDRKGA